MTVLRKLRRRRELAILLVVTASAAIALVSYATHLTRSLELQTVDARFGIRGAEEQPDDIAIVAVDDRTFSELGRQWPFPRSLHARVIDRLREAGAKTIAVDIQFTEPTVPRQDEALIEAVARAGGVVLSATEVNAHGETRVLGGAEVLHEVGARAANTVVIPEPGGKVRKLHYSFDGLVSFPIAIAEAETGEEIDPAEMEGDGEAWIDYRGPPLTLANYSYSRVLQGKVPASAFRGKTVPFTYTVTAFEQDRRIVLDGVGEKATSLDTIVFEPAGDGGTRIAYTADFRLKGVLRLAEPFLGRTFTTLAQHALAGLEARLGDASGSLGT